MKQISIQGEIHSSKNSRQIMKFGGRTMVVKSDASKADEKSFELQLFEQRETWDSLQRRVEYDAPYNVCFRLRRKTRRKFDYINMVQGICDAMVKAGYIKDDDADHLVPSFAPYVIDPQHPGCDFWIV